MQILRKLLFPFSIIYDLVTRLRNYFYDYGYLKSKSFPLPVICVGNLSMGGTGKSPMIAHLLDLLHKDYNVAVLSRGYGRKTKGYIVVEEHATSQEVGDEALQLKRNFPELTLIVCENRSAALEKLKYKVDVVLMDDGFQHRRVKPSFNLVLTAYDSLYINDYVLPAGNLRESKSGVKRSNMVIVSKCPPKIPYARLQQIEYDLKLEENQNLFFSRIVYSENIASISETLSIDYLKDKKFTLVTGIAKPEPLVLFLKDNNFMFSHLKYADHHEFTATEIVALQKEELIITTEKDYVRLQPKLNKFALYYLPIKTEFLNHKGAFFNEKIIEVVEQFKKVN